MPDRGRRYQWRETLEWTDTKWPNRSSSCHPVKQRSSQAELCIDFFFHLCDLNFDHGNEVLPQDTTHLIQRPLYQRGSSCQDPAGNRTTRRPPDHCRGTQTAVVWTSLPFIRSGQNHLARHSERGKKTRQTEEEVGIQHQGMDRPGVRQVPEGSGEQRKMEETGSEIICGAQRPSRLRELVS